MTRMVKITHTYLIDVDAARSAEAERIAHDMLESGEINLDDPTTYSVEDCGKGSWDD